MRRFGLSALLCNGQIQWFYSPIHLHESTDGYQLNVFWNVFSNSSRSQRLRFWRKTYSYYSKETWVRKPIRFHPYRKIIHHFFGLSQVSGKERKWCFFTKNILQKWKLFDADLCERKETVVEVKDVLGCRDKKMHLLEFSEYQPSDARKNRSPGLSFNLHKFLDVVRDQHARYQQSIYGEMAVSISRWNIKGSILWKNWKTTFQCKKHNRQIYHRKCF